jgi:hypothetical protein
MTKWLILLVGVGLVLTVGCKPGADIEAEKQMVRAVLDRYVATVEAEDMELYSANVAQDPAMVTQGAGGSTLRSHPVSYQRCPRRYPAWMS